MSANDLYNMFSLRGVRFKHIAIAGILTVLMLLALVQAISWVNRVSGFEEKQRAAILKEKEAQYDRLKKELGK